MEIDPTLLVANQASQIRLFMRQDGVLVKNLRVISMKTQSILMCMLILASPSAFSVDYVMSAKTSFNNTSVHKPEISDEDRIAAETAEILSRADIVGTYNGREDIAGYGFGNMWAGHNIIAGLIPVPAKSSWTVVIQTNSGQFIAATSFRPNPWTPSPSSGPDIAYFNGVNLKTMNDAANIMKAAAGADLIQRQSWNPTNKGYNILGKYYIFKDRSFPIDRKWK